MSPEKPSDPEAEKVEAKVSEAKATTVDEAAKEPPKVKVEKKPAAAKKPVAAKAATAKPATAKHAETDKEDGEEPTGTETAAEVLTAAEKKAPARKPKPPAKAEAKATPASEAEDEKPEPSARGAARSQTPAPARRKVVRAHARYVRTSARKARMVCGHLRGKSVEEARAILAFTPREVARDWSKLLESAVANAENNHELIEEDLLIREAFADEGPTIKRFQPRAQGRATPIRKRTSHLTITLTPKA
jgi:ribosomal protein L22